MPFLGSFQGTLPGRQAGRHPTRPTLDNGPSESPIVVSWSSLHPSPLSSSPALHSPAPGLRPPLTEEEDFNLGPEHHQPATMSLQDQIQVLMAQLQALQAQLDSHAPSCHCNPLCPCKAPQGCHPYPIQRDP